MVRANRRLLFTIEFTREKDSYKKGSHLWLVENKYYRAKILIQYGCFDETGKVNVEIDKCEALVLVVNWSHELNDSADSLVKLWSNITSQHSTDIEKPAVCLLLAVLEDHHEVDQGPVLKWCVENGFELIEWTSEENQKEDVDSGSTGTARLAEALQAHIWPQITMKSNNGMKSNASDDANTKKLSENEKLLAEEQDFEELFAKFADMKAHAEKLPWEQRKAYAERAVLAFWDAIGGDEEEIKDLEGS